MSQMLPIRIRAKTVPAVVTTPATLAAQGRLGQDQILRRCEWSRPGQQQPGHEP